MIELYHFWSSVCSVKARMCLAEKNLEWESRYIDLFKFDQLTPEYLALNPNGVVPTLVHDGEPVLESTFINEYIDDAFDGPALKPADPLVLARMREFIKQCDDIVLPAIGLTTLMKYILPKLKNRWEPRELEQFIARKPTLRHRDSHMRAVRGDIDDQEIDDAVAQLEATINRIEKLLDPGPWLFGDFSLADIAMAPHIYRMGPLGLTRFWENGRRPRTDAWVRRLYERPAFQKAVSWPDESGGGYEEVGLSAAEGS